MQAALVVLVAVASLLSTGFVGLLKTDWLDRKAQAGQGLHCTPLAHDTQESIHPRPEMVIVKSMAVFSGWVKIGLVLT